MAELAENSKLPLQNSKDIKASGAQQGVFADKEVSKYVFSAGKASGPLARSFQVGGKFYLLQIDSVSNPDMTKFAAKEKDYLKRASDQLAQNFSESLVNQLKAQAQIDIDPSIMGGA